MSRFDVRKAVIPAAGLGTRFLPATKASPKEMLPLVDKPLIQYAVEEAVASGIEDIIIITGRGKRAIEDHFDRSVELEENLKGNGKAQLLSQMRHISTLANFCYVRQSEALGLGHAVLCAQRLIGDEPFAVILGDEIIDAPVAGLAQLIHAYKKRHGAILGVQEVPHHDVNRYGIVAPRTVSPGLHRVEGLIEKPIPAEAPSNLAVIGRYVLPPEIFSILRKTRPGKNGEWLVTRERSRHGLQRTDEVEIYETDDAEAKHREAEQNAAPNQVVAQVVNFHRRDSTARRVSDEREKKPAGEREARTGREGGY